MPTIPMCPFCDQTNVDLEHTCSHETMWPWILMDPLSVQELRAKVQHFGYIMRRVLDL